MAETKIFTTFSVFGTHDFPGAATDPALVDVAFLAFEHGHDFHVGVSVEVAHDEREIEFLQFRRWLRATFGAEPVRFGAKSCETIARDLLSTILARYPGRRVTVRVAEDGHSGAEVSS